MNIGLITYNYPHLKTEQVFLQLIHNYPDFNYTFYALPFNARPTKERLIKHRPNQFNAPHPKDLARFYRVGYEVVNSDLEIASDYDYYIILGAGILSADFVRNKKIINCHPGVIPAVRGLDAFKWAIYEKQPLGITLHYINEDVDSGQIISILKTPIFKNDTIETLARRHYELEIYILGNFWYFIQHPKNDFIKIQERKPHKRMKREREEEIISHLFKEYIQLFGK